MNRCVAAVLEGRAKVKELSQIFNIPKSTLQDNVKRVEYEIQKRMKLREEMKRFQMEIPEFPTTIKREQED